MSDLYDADILLWSEHQASLLRRMAAGEKLNEQPDWPNIIEEMESVGRSQLTAVELPILQSLLHTLKAQAWPRSREVGHWRVEAIGFRDDAFRSYVPSMRQRIDLDRLYRQALRRIPPMIDNHPPLALPPSTSLTVDEFFRDAE